jgi:hypothetical protein
VREKEERMWEEKRERERQKKDNLRQSGCECECERECECGRDSWARPNFPSPSSPSILSIHSMFISLT